jgi:GNAT superfamily N-acetyltransferase
VSSVAVTRIVRGVHADEVNDVVTQLELWLGARGKLAGSYPQVFGPESRAELFGVFEGDVPCSLAACRTVSIHAESGPVAAAMVGSVVTAPERRGRGLASELLREVVQWARDGGHDVAMLWSDRWDFYQRLGFVPSGRQLEVALTPPRAALSCDIRAAGFGDLPAIHRLHAHKPCAVARDIADLAVLLSAEPMTTVVLERGGEVVAYACQGKGLDFDGWWHEVGGSDGDVAELITGAMGLLGQERATLMLPEYRGDLVAKLGPSVAEVREGVSALCLPLTDRGRAPLFVDGLDSI